MLPTVTAAQSARNTTTKTIEFGYSGGAVTSPDRGLGGGTARRRLQRIWHCLRWYKTACNCVCDYPGARSRPKVQTLKAGVLETLIFFGCVPWNPSKGTLQPKADPPPPSRKKKHEDPTHPLLSRRACQGRLRERSGANVLRRRILLEDFVESLRRGRAPVVRGEFLGSWSGLRATPGDRKRRRSGWDV